MADHTQVAPAANVNPFVSLTPSPLEALRAMHEWVDLMHNSTDGLFFITELNAVTHSGNGIRLFWLMRMAGEYFKVSSTSIFALMANLEGDDYADCIELMSHNLEEAKLSMDAIVTHTTTWLDGVDDEDQPLDMVTVMWTLQALLKEFERCCLEMRRVLSVDGAAMTAAVKAAELAEAAAEQAAESLGELGAE